MHLLFFDFKDNASVDFFSFTMSYDIHIISELVKLMDGKSGTLGPCNMIGIKNKDSVYNERNGSKLKEYYEHSYSVYKGQPNFHVMIEKAVREASIWAQLSREYKEKILTGQCKMIRDTYNSMFGGGGRELLSGICLASSILVMTVVMKSTYVELETENPIVPELHVWANKALKFLKGYCGQIMDHKEHIEEQVNQMRKLCRHNKASLDYLEMRDITISDLVSDATVSGVIDKIRGDIPLRGGAAANAETPPFVGTSPGTPEGGGGDGDGEGSIAGREDLGTPESKRSIPTRNATVVGHGERGEGEVLIEGTPKPREELEYMVPDYYTSFSEYTEMLEPNAEKWTKFLELITLRMNESDLLQILNLFEGYCPDDDDLEIMGDEDKCMKILEDEVEELNESFLCYLSCMSDDFDMIIPGRMYGEIKYNEGSETESGRIKKTKKRNIKKTSKVKTKRKYNRKKRKTTKKKKRKTTRKKKKKQGDLIDKIIERLGY